MLWREGEEQAQSDAVLGVFSLSLSLLAHIRLMQSRILLLLVYS